MKIKKEFIILAVVLVALIAYLIINGTSTGKVNYKLPKLVKIKSKEIDKIDFATASEKITLVFDTKADIWRISPQNYPAEKGTVDSMLKEIEELEVTELISDKKVYEKYDLDVNNRITVMAFKEDKKLRGFDVGKATDTSNHTFIKLTDDANVYNVKSNLRTLFTKTVADLRDKNVMTANKDAIQQISITYKGETTVINKTVLPKEKETDTEKTEWNIAGTDKKADQTQVEEILNTVSSLQCDSFIPEDQLVDFSTPYCTVVLKGDKEYKLSALELRSSDNMHPATASTNDYQFYLIGWKMNRLMKTTDELTEKPK